MDTKNLTTDMIMEVINNLPEEKMNMDKHNLKDIILFIESVLVSLSFTTYLMTYNMKKQQEQGY